MNIIILLISSYRSTQVSNANAAIVIQSKHRKEELDKNT